ncbi:MAG: histidine phosphatase family protein [Spirosomataceae bacterium]
MLTVYLLRHGESVWNLDGNRYCGSTDVPLTDRGMDQARQVKELLKNVKFDAVYSSPLQRAYKTAQIATPHDPADVIVAEELKEASFGKWEGKTREEFIAEDPALWEAWEKDPGTARAGGTGNTALEIVTNVDSFFKKAAEKHPNGTILVVAHNGVNRFYLAYKLGMPLRNYRRIVQLNSAITRFTLNDRLEISLDLLNVR